MNTALWKMDSGLAAPPRPGMTIQGLNRWEQSLVTEKAHALAPARPEPDRHTRTAPCHTGDGARDRAARLCRHLGIELVRQHGAVHRPRLRHRTHHLRDGDRADLCPDRRGIR